MPGHDTEIGRQPNPLLLAAEEHPDEQLLALLRAEPGLAKVQDEHGYSLLHACASYNHLDILRALVNEFGVNVNIKDEDGESALFVTETIECAKVLVEELHADITIRGEDSKTAREKIEEEGDFPQVAVYLRIRELESGGPPNGDRNGISLINGLRNGSGTHAPPPLPPGVTINMGTMEPEDVGGEVVDHDFRRRIEELAQRDDFQGETGQEALRNLITEAIRGNVGQERDVRRRLD